MLIALRNRLEHVLAYWALQLIAAVPTPVSFRAAAGEMRYMLEDCDARVALLEADTAPAVLAAAAGRDMHLRVRWSRRRARGHGAVRRSARHERPQRRQGSPTAHRRAISR